LHISDHVMIIKWLTALTLAA